MRHGYQTHVPLIYPFVIDAKHRYINERIYEYEKQN